LIRFSATILYLILLVLVSSACEGSFDRITQTSIQAIPTRSPVIGLTRTVTPTFTATWTLEPSATQVPETATETPPPTSTVTPTLGLSNTTQFPDPETYEWRLIVSGLTQPIGLANAGDGSDRLFVLEQPGLIRIIQDNELLPEPFLDITSQVSCCGERGLLGIAFHQQYEENGFFFVNYSDLNGDTVIARFQTTGEIDRANPESEVKLLVVEQPYSNHNGGGMAFGPNGYLYIGLGDGGSGGDPQGNAQDTNTLLGKLLRLDVDQGDFYAIPPDNPYAQTGGAPEVWAYGLRNPWRLSFDRLTGDLYIGDVGQGSWEEIDYIPAGNSGSVNFGWNHMEGAHPYGNSAAPGDINFTDPVAEYGRAQGYSVIGGVVYRGEELPDWQGLYFYGDYGSGIIWGLLPAEDDSWQNRMLYQTGTSITSFGEDESGEVYFVSYQGDLYQLVKR
jgi:glucose/arabinose dehydrogenase